MPRSRRRRSGARSADMAARIGLRRCPSRATGPRYPPDSPTLSRVERYEDVSFWLETAGDLTPRPPLDGTTTADVAILGAGYTGLWTAYYLLERRPGLRIIVAEGEIAGFGASGRNGAWCAPDLNISMDRLARLHGEDAARRTQQATYDASTGSGRGSPRGSTSASTRAGAAGRPGGGAHQSRRSRSVPGYEASGSAILTGSSTRLVSPIGGASRAACAGSGRRAPRSSIPGAWSAGWPTWSSGWAPGSSSGARLRIPGSGRAGPAAWSRRGEIRAPVLVLAGEAYLPPGKAPPPARPDVLPSSSRSPSRRPLARSVGGREVVASLDFSIDYLSRTADGRILFGGRGAPYRLGSPIRDRYDRHEPTHEMLRGFVRAWFPMLRDVRFTHAWGGPLGMPRDWHPTVAFDPRSGIATARGYVGHGVSTANLAGRTLADLIAGERSDLTELPLVGHRSPDWRSSRSAGWASATRRAPSLGWTAAPRRPDGRRRAAPSPRDRAALRPGPRAAPNPEADPAAATGPSSSRPGRRGCSATASSRSSSSLPRGDRPLGGDHWARPGPDAARRCRHLALLTTHAAGSDGGGCSSSGRS